MYITISPATKFSIMSGMVIIFLVVIHFGIVPNLGLMSVSELSAALRVVLVVSVFVIGFAVLTYANVFRPLVPGQSSWKQGKFWCPLIIEKSPAGVGKLFPLFIQTFIFSVVLYGYVRLSIERYKIKIPEIINGTYEYERIDALFMGAPLIMVFLLLLYLGVKLFDNASRKNSYKIR